MTTRPDPARQFLRTLNRCREVFGSAPSVARLARCASLWHADRGREVKVTEGDILAAAKALDLLTGRRGDEVRVACAHRELYKMDRRALALADEARRVNGPVDSWAVMLGALAGDPAPLSKLGTALPVRQCNPLADGPGDEYAARWEGPHTAELPTHHPEPASPASVDLARPGAVLIFSGTALDHRAEGSILIESTVGTASGSIRTD